MLCVWTLSKEYKEKVRDLTIEFIKKRCTLSNK